MAEVANVRKAAGVSNEAVESKTGKSWDAWFALLDRAGATEWPHKQIAAYLHEDHDCPSWWSQTVTVGYEQARGLRTKHQMPGGFQISRSKTLAVPTSVAYRAWHDKRRRKGWLADPDFTVRKATADKSIRITWIDGTSTVEVMFYPKGEEKCQITVQHNKLADAEAGERMKVYWGEQLERLQMALT